MGPRLNGRSTRSPERVEKAMPGDDMPMMGPGGGLVELARRALAELANCHITTEAVRDGLLPSPPTACNGELKEAMPSDLTTVLNRVLQSAQELSDKLQGMRDTIVG